jgi:tetratricopeptide (TPR) repeat protein
VGLQDVYTDTAFPALFTFYDNNSIGTATLKNSERFPIKEIEIDLYSSRFMDKPKRCTAPAELRPGEEGTVDLYALFSESVLDLKEGTKFPAEFTVRYTMNGIRRESSVVKTMSIHHRNAMTWDDDRKAAAFVSAKDPDILKLSKLVAGIVRKEEMGAVNQNLQMAVGLYETLSAYGLSYVIDPNTPSYEEASENTSVIDFLQYPVETLEYRGGDCDDLSILYCSLLEAIGIETAFVTVPGHILMAFSLDISPEEARQFFSEEEMLIFREEKAWIPVEMTRVGESFLEAWSIGIEQWQQNEPQGSVGFYPMQVNWRTYESAGSPPLRGELELPSAEQIAEVYRDSAERFAERELYPQIAELERAISRANDPAKLMNRLGVLYARYGLNDKAEKLFSEILMQQEYLPAIINLGNIYFAQEKYDQAREMYERAETTKPDNRIVLLNLARIHYEAKRYAEVRNYYSRLEKLYPDLGKQFAYLSDRDRSQARAADLELLQKRMVWEVEEE